MIFNAALAVLAVAAPVMAGTKVGCLTSSDCDAGYVCNDYNICVAKAAPSSWVPLPSSKAPLSSMAPKPWPSKSTVTKVTTWTSTVTTCDSGKCSPCTVCPIYTCVGDQCDVCDECAHQATAVPTVTVIECAACEGGYTTSTCYPDVTTTITACNTCMSPAPTTAPTPASTSCTTSTPVIPPSSMPVFHSGAERSHVAYAGLVGAVAIAAFFL